MPLRESPERKPSGEVHCRNKSRPTYTLDPDIELRGNDSSVKLIL